MRTFWTQSGKIVNIPNGTFPRHPSATPEPRAKRPPKPLSTWFATWYEGGRMRGGYFKAHTKSEARSQVKKLADCAPELLGVVLHESNPCGT